MKYFYDLEQETRQVVEEHSKSVGVESVVKVYDDRKETAELAETGISTTMGTGIQGERLMIGLAFKFRGTGSQPHRHPNEQFIYVLKGSLKSRVGDQEKIVRAGGAIHIPANTLHYNIATPDEDVLFFVAKDTSWGIVGIPEDKAKTRPNYLPGFERKR